MADPIASVQNSSQSQSKIKKFSTTTPQKFLFRDSATLSIDSDHVPFLTQRARSLFAKLLQHGGQHTWLVHGIWIGPLSGRTQVLVLLRTRHDFLVLLMIADKCVCVLQVERFAKFWSKVWWL